MAELPTPHSIAIGTLISLYSDPNSPLLVLDWHNADSNSSSRRRGGNSGGGGEPQSTTEWSLRLMALIQRLVVKEDEGVVILPNIGSVHDGNNLFYNDENDPASSDHQDYRGRANNIGGPMQQLQLDNLLHNDDFFKKHGLDGGNDILDDVLGLFDGHHGAAEMQGKGQMMSKQDGNSISSRAGGGDALNFCMETLSALLDRIDSAFTSNTSCHPTNTEGRRQQRTPPSLALLSRLQMASTSVDDLMNLLDEWHALLEGTHMGYPPAENSTNNPAAVASTIAIDGESTFGVYLRRLCLGMEEIPFEALARLWDALRDFVREEMKMQHKELGYEDHHLGGGGGESKSSNNANDDDLMEEGEYHHGNSSDWLPSSPQIERIVRKTCLENNLDSLLAPNRGGDEHIEERGEDDGSYHHGISSNISNRQQHLTHNLLQTHPECPSIHFLLFLSSLRNNQRSAALESLHRYFDYAMIHERKERAERTLLMLQHAGGADGEGGGLGYTGGFTRMASGMGGITGGMTGGIINGSAVGGGGAMPGGVGGAPGQQRGAAAGASEMAGKMFRESNVMQYAAILLAQTYHRFGYTRLSLQATEEAIRVAQQSGDEECVCFANGWLALVGSSVGSSGSSSGSGGRQSVYASVGGLAAVHGSNVNDSRYFRPLADAVSSTVIANNASSPQDEEAMLQRCRARASERGLVSLAAGASLELARRMAYRRPTGDGSGLDTSEEEGDTAMMGSSSLAWACVQSSGRMPVAGTAATGGHGRGGVSHRGVVAPAVGSMAFGQGPTDIYNMTNTESSTILGRQNVAVAGLWESTGHSSLASLSSTAALYGSTSNLGGDELTITAKERVLGSLANGPGLDVWRVGSTNDGLVSLENNTPRNHMGESYAAILNRIVSMSQSFTNNSSLESMATISSSTLLEWSLRSHDLAMARGLRTLLANRAAFPSSNGSGGVLSSVESSVVYLNQSTHLFCQQEQYDMAKASARRACWLATRHNLLFHHGWNLLQLAMIDMEALSSAPTKSLSIERVLPPLLECVSLSEEYLMDPLHAVALLVLSKVFLCIGRYQKARATLQAAMPLVMQHGRIWFQGEAFLTLAKCHLAEVQQRTQHHDSPSSLRNLYETALSELQEAAMYFTKIEDIGKLRQVYYLQARVCHTLDSRKKRDEASKLFAKLSFERRERTRSPVMAVSPRSSKQQGAKSKQWDALQGIMITTPTELSCCLTLKMKGKR